jgi:hypothetical protein
MAYDVVKKKHVSREWCCGIGDDVGSVVFPAADQRRLYDKIDDVRYDVRRAGALAGAGLAAIAGAVATLGIAEMYRAIKGRT